MKNKTVKIIMGAGFGDEGKGLAVDYFCEKAKNPLVFRMNGGCQSGHTVERNGERIEFHHFGSGTLLGVPTYLGPRYIVNPQFFMEEYEQIKDKAPEIKVIVNSGCRMSTPFDVLINQMREISRGDNRHGSVGKGIFETIKRYRKMTSSFGMSSNLLMSISSIFKADESKLETYLNIVRDYHKEYSPELFSNPKLKKYVEIYNDPNLIKSFIYDIMRMKDIVVVKSGKINLNNHLINSYDTHIYEVSQGLLLDQKSTIYMPHCTPSSTGSDNLMNTMFHYDTDNCDFEFIYVTRTYMTRHGAGDFMTECGKYYINPDLFDASNVDNEFQGNLRYGWFDTKEIKRAIYADYSKFVMSSKIRPKLSIMVTHLNETNGYIVLDEYKFKKPEDIFFEFDRIYKSDGKTAESVSFLEE